MGYDVEFLGLAEVSAYLNISKSTIYKLTQKGGLPACKIGKQLRFRKSSIDKWIAERECRAVVQMISLDQQASGGSLTHYSKQVLLIDDDDLILRTISRLLGMQGYTVETAKNAQEALAKVETMKFGLVITDIRMPGINGIETLKRIRQINAAQERQPSQEVVITGYMDSLAEQEARNLGVTAYIYKPFSIAEFLKTIQEKLCFNAGTLSVGAPS